MDMLTHNNSPEQWAETAVAMFNSKHFEDAAACFERANDSFNAQRSQVSRSLLSLGSPTVTVLPATKFLMQPSQTARMEAY